MKRNHKIIIGLILLFVVAIVSINLEKILFLPTDTKLESKKLDSTKFEVIAENLDVPWEIVFLPTGEMLVTERSGTLLIIGEEEKEVFIQSVAQDAEGGLLGMAIHPKFEENNFVYIYITYEENNELLNRIERYKLNNNILTEKKTIIEGIPGAPYHDGGRIEFGPDGFLYITTGDATNPDLAQDLDSLAGKILRLKDDGTLPEDNPFDSAVYSYGHRNPQGLAWDSSGNLWATEHGRSGRLSGMDELNLIKMGKNYGWPIIEGNELAQGMVAPKINSGPDETWAPAGLAFYEGSLFFAGLRGETLYEAKIENGDVIDLKAHLRKEFGRLRAVAVGPDNSLYLSTSNADGRGIVRDNDDKIIKMPLEVFGNQNN